MIISVPKETFPGERRVALTPSRLASLIKAGLSVQIESGAGAAAGFPDDAYRERQATIVADRSSLLVGGDVILQVRTPGANPNSGPGDIPHYKAGALVIGFAEPLTQPAITQAMAQRGVTLLAMELIPRISRAQSMDALSSMASIAGYKAVLLAANELARLFPMMMTAAGTITPAKVLVIGAGVAGLQAIATARRLGAVVSAYDVRPAVKEQILSLGAKFIELPLETGDAQTVGGYAKEQSAEQQRRQRELMAGAVREADVVISTAAVPGKKAPVLITAEMVRGMRPGSVIIDLAAATGGNCELTRADERVEVDGVCILGPTNLPSTLAFHASELYSNNLCQLLLHLVKDGKPVFDQNDPISRDSMVTRDGQVVNAMVSGSWSAAVKSEVKEPT
ncbi:MAG: Re/Si-specific NAD(P)(+) transhydrogenase subunit alpha [Phycisphaerae bacterium]